MKPLLDEVDRLINQLPAEDLLRRARFHPEDQKMFGNALVIYDSPKLKIRFIKDRGEIGVDVCAPGKESWWPLDQICEVLGRPLPGLDFDSNAKGACKNSGAPQAKSQRPARARILVWAQLSPDAKVKNDII